MSDSVTRKILTESINGERGSEARQNAEVTSVQAAIRRTRRNGAPTAADNFANGYNYFDLIMDNLTQDVYICVNPLTPLWKPIT